jgi:ankyrin repeat protein
LILNARNQSALHIASIFNRLAIVKELLSLTQTSLLEIKDNHGQTALSVTTNTDIIDTLITSGANISSRDNKHMNVLMIAVSKNRLSIVEHLLFAINDKQFEIFNQVTKRKNRSIFLLAVHTGSIPLCSTLLKHQYIRWDTVDKNRRNIFHIAAQDDHYELMDYLCNHIRKSVQIFSTKSISYLSPDSDLLNIIPQASPILRLYIDAQNEDGKTPLHIAAEQGHRLCIEILLKHSVDVLLPNYLGQLALHTAIQHGHSRCVEILLESLKRNTSDFQLVLSRRQSPLLNACQNGFSDIVRILLSQGIGIDDKSYENNENPLEIAIKYRQIHVINELLEHSYLDNWLMSIRNTNKHSHQTPLRDMIRYTPDCAIHAFDKFITKTKEIDQNGNTFERTTYNYKYIDDYFT